VAVAPWSRRSEGVLLQITLQRASSIHASIYDIAGRKIRTLSEGFAESGEYVMRWNARDEGGIRVRAGIYFVRVQGEQDVVDLRTILLN